MPASSTYLHAPGSEPPRGLRERKKARAREAIVAASLRLFGEKGFERTTVDEIAAAADVARRTFFRYFATKEAVLWRDRERRLARFRDDLGDPRQGEAPFAMVRRALLSMAAEFMEHREELLAVQRIVEASPALLALDRAFDRDWESTMATALRGSASARGDRRARVLAAATMGVIRATLAEWLDGGCDADLVALGTETLDMLESGLGTPKRKT